MERAKLVHSHTTAKSGTEDVAVPVPVQQSLFLDTTKTGTGACNEMGGLLGDTVCVTTSISGSDDKNITGDYY